LTYLLGSDPFVDDDVADDAFFVEDDVAVDAFTLLAGRSSSSSEESSGESDSDESSYESDSEESFDLYRNMTVGLGKC
jgi:hypothetical protein